MLGWDRLSEMFLNEPWVITLAIVLLATVIVRFVAKHLLSRFLKLTAKTNSYWDDVVIHSASKPLLLLIWIVGLYIAANVVLKADVLSVDFSLIKSIRDAGITICMAWFFWRLIDGSSDKYLQSKANTSDEVDHTTVDALTKLGHLVVMVVAILSIMQVLGFSVSGILAAGGIGGIAIGFAAKDILANFFGGLTIYLDRPFSVGDWIRSPDKDIEGVVEMISWRHTRIRRFNKNALYVPNSVFTTVVVENPSRMTNRRIKETIGLRYDDIKKVEGIVSDVEAMLNTHPDIAQDQTLLVNFNAFNASSVDFSIYTFTKTKVWKDYLQVKQDVLLKIAAIVEKNGAEMAFPTQTLHMASHEKTS